MTTIEMNSISSRTSAEPNVSRQNIDVKKPERSFKDMITDNMPSSGAEKISVLDAVKASNNGDVTEATNLAALALNGETSNKQDANNDGQINVQDVVLNVSTQKPFSNEKSVDIFDVVSFTSESKIMEALNSISLALKGETPGQQDTNNDGQINIQDVVLNFKEQQFRKLNI